MLRGQVEFWNELPAVIIAIALFGSIIWVPLLCRLMGWA